MEGYGGGGGGEASRRSKAVRQRYHVVEGVSAGAVGQQAEGSNSTWSHAQAQWGGGQW